MTTSSLGVEVEVNGKDGGELVYIQREFKFNAFLFLKAV
jgi:hypothetical protein